MENFGIFTILSALARMQAEKAQARPAPPQEEPPASTAPPRQTPPASPAPPREEKPAGVFTAAERAARAGQILARHDAISRRIDKNNRGTKA